MAFADTIRARLAYRTEAGFNEDATGITTALQALRITGEGFEAVKETTESEEIQDGGNLVELIQVGQLVRGFFDFELSYGHFDDFLAAVFRRRSFTDTVGAKSITGVAATDVFTSSSDHGLEIGDRVVLSSLTGGSGLTDGGVYYVISVPTTTTFTLSTTLGGSSVNFTTNLTAATLTVTNYLRNGSDIKSFYFERYFADLGIYHYFSGCMVDTLNLSINARQKITGKFTFLGIYGANGTASRGSSTTAAPSSAEILTAGPRVSGLTLDGSSTTKSIRKIDLEIRSNLRPRGVVDSIYGKQPGLGDWRMMLKPEFYFEADTFTTKKLAHTTMALGFTLGTTSGASNGTYAFSLPRLQIAKSMPSANKKNEDVIDALELVATKSSTIGAMCSVVRTAGS